MAILNGNYGEVAKDGEELPDYVVRLLPFLRYKAISKGARKGERVSPELFSSLDAPASKEELDRFRPRRLLARLCRRQESDILAGAIKRSELLHQSRTPILERTDLKLWDGTWIGRIAMSLSGSNLSIRGGQTNHGFRGGDVALADLFEEVRERRLVQEGCKKFGLHWLSQIVSEDGSTWAEELQVHKKHFNGSFSYPFYSVNGLGERTKSTHTVRSTTWLSKVKTAAVKLSPNLGTYHAGCKPELQEFDVILFPGDPVPRIVLVVQEGKVVSLSTVSGMNPSRHKHTDAVHRRWNTAASCGPGIRSSLSSLVYSVDDTCTGRCDPLHKAIKVEVQLLPRQGEIDFFHWIRLEDLFESGDVEWSNPLVGGVFFRTCVDEEWLSLQSESVGVSTVNRFQIWSQSECWAEMDKVCGIDCFSPNLEFGAAGGGVDVPCRRLTSTHCPDGTAKGAS